MSEYVLHYRQVHNGEPMGLRLMETFRADNDDAAKKRATSFIEAENRKARDSGLQLTSGDPVVYAEEELLALRKIR